MKTIYEVDALCEVNVEEVEVERCLHDASGDGNGIDHVLREVSMRGTNQCPEVGSHCLLV